MKLRLFSMAVLFLAPTFAVGQRVHAREPHHANSAATQKQPQMLYHNGPVMVGNNHIYVIYYGRFSSLSTNIIDTFLENLGGSGAYGVNTTYYNGTGQHIQNVASSKTSAGSLAYSRSADAYYDNYSMGPSMKGKSIVNEIQSVLQGGHLPLNDNGIYILITSPDVVVATNYCGYHTASASMVSGHTIKYAFSPDPPGPTYNGCSGNYSTFGDTTSPNGDVGADSVTDTLMHEISETVTDPEISAWYTNNGYENGDLCNFVYGTTSLDPINGSHYNHTFGGLNYLVQTIWKNVGTGSCALSYP